MAVDKSIATIHRLDPGELEQHMDRIKELFDEHREEDFAPNMFQKFWEENLEKQQGAFWIAKKLGNLVGTMSAVFYPRPNTKEYVAEALDWYVTPDERGSGLGSQMLKTFENWAEEKGAKYVMSGMSSFGSDLTEYYEDRGYEGHSVMFEKEL